MGSLRIMDFFKSASPASGFPVPSSAISMRGESASQSPSYNLSCNFVLGRDMFVSTKFGSTAMFEFSALLFAIRKYPLGGIIPSGIVNIKTSPSSVSLVICQPAMSISPSVVFRNSIHSLLMDAKSPIHMSSLKITMGTSKGGCTGWLLSGVPNS